MSKSYISISSYLFATLLIGGCAGNQTSTQSNIYEPLRKAPLDSGEIVFKPSQVDDGKDDSLRRVTQTPSYVIRDDTLTLADTSIEDSLSGESVQVRYHDMPLQVFIREVFSEQLGLSFTIDPALSNSQDLVTLNLVEPVTPAELYRTARVVLADYGVAISYSDNLLQFKVDSDAAGEAIPLMVSGKTLPMVPPSHRPIFLLLPLEVVGNSEVSKWIRGLFAGTPLTIADDPSRNSVLLRGPLEIVKQAERAVRMLDQPLMKGKYSKSFRPEFLSAESLTSGLVQVLKTEGYAASSAPPYGSIIILPLKEQGRILLFAASENVLAHAIEWAEELDSKQQAEISQGYFSYQAQNVTAEHIAEILGAFEGGGGTNNQGDPQGVVGSLSNSGGSSSNRNGRSGNNDGGSSRVGKTTGAGSYMGGKLVIDYNRNVLFYKGGGQEWNRLLRLIKDVDKPVPSVLVEVLLAEVTLSDQQDQGFEFTFSGSGPLGTSVIGNGNSGTLGRLDLGGSGLAVTFDSAGQTRAILNAFYRNDKAVIRSSPTILVKSGESASIEVGNDIPVITSNSQSTTDANAPIIQSIQYRKTGVLLNIEPVVQASGMVDMHISQELSETQVTQTSATGSPIILKRSIDTTLTLKDGSSVLLGGLISTSKSEGESGIPVLGKLPIIGRLFRTNTTKETTTELLMLVTPYVIRDNDEAKELTDILSKRLNLEKNM